jgi:hypothetical protein
MLVPIHSSEAGRFRYLFEHVVPMDDGQSFELSSVRPKENKDE